MDQAVYGTRNDGGEAAQQLRGMMRRAIRQDMEHEDLSGVPLRSGETSWCARCNSRPCRCAR